MNKIKRYKCHNILVYEEGWRNRGNQKPLKDQCKNVE